MGLESVATVHLTSISKSCRVQLEPGELIVRGPIQRKYPLDQLSGMFVKDGQLCFAMREEAVAIDLGKAAIPWLERIRNPRSRAQKLGLIAGLKVCLLGKVEPHVTSEVDAITQESSTRRLSKNMNMVLFFVEEQLELNKLATIEKALAPGGMIWVLFPKGRKDLTHQVMVTAGRLAGLSLSKSMAFSETLTGVRLGRAARKN